MLPVLFVFLLRIQGLNELSYMLKEREFKNLFPRGTVVSSIDIIRDMLKSINLDGLSYINESIIIKRPFKIKYLEMEPLMDLL